MRAKKDSIFSIFGGPSREKLFSAMEYQYDKDAHVDIKFLFGTSYPISFAEGQDYAKSIVETKNIQIESIKHMNNSGYRFVLTGLMEARLIPVFSYERYSFTIIYNAEEHTGSIRLKRL